MDKRTAKTIYMTAMLLVVIGALNWGLVGLLNLNLVSTIFGSIPSAEKLIYILVGASGVYLMANMGKKM